MHGNASCQVRAAEKICKGLAEREALAFVETLPRLYLSHERLPGIWVTMVDLSEEQEKPPAHDVPSLRAIAPGFGNSRDAFALGFQFEYFATPRGALVHILNGGYIIGGAASEVSCCEWLATELEYLIDSPDYPLAPETKHPEARLRIALRDGSMTEAMNSESTGHALASALRS